jgi:hypothetical protein
MIRPGFASHFTALDKTPTQCLAKFRRAAAGSTNCVSSPPDTAAFPIWLWNLKLTKRNDMKKLIHRHRDIAYTLANIEPDLWSWSFEINGKTRRGTTRARLGLLAQRRVCIIIDRELKNAARTRPRQAD